MARKGPQYLNCNERQSSCTRKQAEPRKGCPKCEFTVQYKIFVSELEKELGKLKTGTRQGTRKWPVPMLLEMVAEIATISARYKDRHSPKWTVPISIYVGIYRDESGKKRAIDNFNLLPAESQTSALSGKSDDDEGDFD